MELKVWVEGIQRIVCGVTERTTCQDVVYALAHATGKTGRFTLIERWRNNERLLAPQEHPLKVLLKWGEYSNDVHFILQRSPLDKSPSPHPGRPASQAFKSTTPTTPTPTANNELPETPTPTHESPVSPTGSNPSPPSRELKKSLTFSGGHPSGEFAPRRMGVVKGVPQNTNMPDVLNTSVDSIQSTNSAARLRLSNQSPRPTELRIPVAAAAAGVGSTGYVQPPPYRDPPLPNSRGASPAGTNNAIVATSRSSNRELPQPPPYRDPPRPRGQSPLANGAVKPGVKWGGNEERIDLNSSWASRSSWESPLRSVDEEVDLLSHNSQRRSTSPVKRNLLQEFQATEASTDGDRDNNNSNPTVPSGAKRLLPATPTGAPPRPPSPTHDPQLGALIQLLNRQREKLEAQHAENGQYDADIEKYEQKAREREAVLEAMVQESTRLEELSQQAEEQIAVLEGTEMEMESVQAQESYLRSEIQTCQNKVSDYDRELQALRDQMRSLISDIRAEEKTMKDAEQQQSRELEEEFDRLNADLNTARVQSELCAQVEQQMDKEITSLEHTLADKKADLDRLIADIKQANLQSLSIAPVEESRHTVEGVGLISGGSGRRIIGSPRQLESAVPTNKNPHGVWV